MRLQVCLNVFIIMLITLSSTGVVAAPGNIDMFEVRLGGSRVVYNLSSSGSTLSVKNPQTYPMLVQSEVMKSVDVAGDISTDFLVTPPLFRLDGGQQSKLRIVRVGGEFSTDRESLQFLCIKGIPPEKDDVWAADSVDKKNIDYVNNANVSVKVAVRQCIKMFVRPSGIMGGGEPSKTLKWRQEGSKLRVDNPSPFYVSFASLDVDGSKVRAGYVPPFSTRKYILPKSTMGKVKQVKWTTVNDYGGESNVYEMSLM